MMFYAMFKSWIDASNSKAVNKETLELLFISYRIVWHKMPFETFSIWVE